MSLLYALLVGVVMGALIQRVGASSPRMILASLRLENLTVIKFMAVTIAVGTVGVYLLDRWIPMHFDIKPLYAIGVLVGGLIFGVGFAVSGYCPGTCVVGMGEGRRDAVVTLLGGITGAVLFTVLYNTLYSSLIAPMDFGKVTIASALGLPPLVAAIALAAVLVAASALMPTQRAVARSRRSP